MWIRLQLKCDATRWRTGGEVKGKLTNAVGSQYPSHYFRTWCTQHYYRWCALLGCQQSTELTPSADWNGLVRFARKTKSGFCACAITFQLACTRSHTTARLRASSFNFYGVFYLAVATSVFTLSSFCRTVQSHTNNYIFLPFYMWTVKAVIIRSTIICLHTATLFSCRPCADTMELEELYGRYCDRLKHSLFVNSLLIAAVGCVVSVVALCAFSSTVSMCLLQQCCCNSAAATQCNRRIWVLCTVMRRIKKFLSTTDRIYDGGPIRL